MKQLKIAARRIVKYVRVDLREIIFPSSLPDPADYRRPRKLSWPEEWEAFRIGTRLYLDSWSSPVAERKENVTGTGEDKEELLTREMGLMQEFTMTAKTSTNLQPALMKLYRGQMNAFQLAITNFVEGYREGASEKADLPKLFQGMSSEQGPIGQASRSPEAEPVMQQPEPGTTLQGSLQQNKASDIGSFGRSKFVRATQEGDSSDSESRASGQQQNLVASDLPDSQANELGKGLPASVRQQGKADSSPEGSLVSRAVKANISEQASQLTDDRSESGGPTAPSGSIEPRSQTSSQPLEIKNGTSMMPGQSNSQATQSSGSGSQPERKGESPQVAVALDRAEDLARALLQPGGITEKRRKELEAAILEAETAMSQVAQKLEDK